MRYNFEVPINQEDAVYVSAVSIEFKEGDLDTYEKFTGIKGMDFDKEIAKGRQYNFYDENRFNGRLALCVYDCTEQTGLPRAVVSAHASDDNIAKIMLAQFMEITGSEEIDDIGEECIMYYYDGERRGVSKLLNSVLGAEK